MPKSSKRSDDDYMEEETQYPKTDETEPQEGPGAPPYIPPDGELSVAHPVDNDNDVEQFGDEVEE